MSYKFKITVPNNKVSDFQNEVFDKCDIIVHVKRLPIWAPVDNPDRIFSFVFELITSDACAATAYKLKYEHA